VNVFRAVCFVAILIGLLGVILDSYEKPADRGPIFFAASALLMTSVFCLLITMLADNPQ